MFETILVSILLVGVGLYIRKQLKSKDEDTGGGSGGDTGGDDGRKDPSK